MRRVLAPLVVAAVAGGATTAATLRWPVLATEPRPPGPVRSSPVVERSLLCPDLSGVPGRTFTRATVAALPGPAGSGTAVMAPLAGRSAVSLPPLGGPGSTAIADTAAAGGPIRVDARGPLAAGVAAEQVTRSDGGPARGLAETRCPAVAPEMWFVGGATTVGSSASLILVNPDNVPATADVTLLTPTGTVFPRSARGIEVRPRSSVRLALESLAPDSAALATHVRVVAGRLAAALFDARRRADLPLGVDYVPLSLAPARTAVVPGLLGGPGPRRVLVAAPGSDDATVQLRVTSSEGSFVPAAFNAVRVPAGTVIQVELAGVLAGRSAAVTLTSDVPVLAGAISGQVDARTGVGEFAWTGASPPLQGPALVPDDRVRAQADSVLVLTAPTTAARVEIVTLGARGPAGRPIAISVPAGTTVDVPLHRLAVPTGSFAVVVTPLPGSGPVYGARVLFELGSRGVLVSALTLARTGALVALPDVIEDPAAGSP